jgi:hypothetical protein
LDPSSTSTPQPSFTMDRRPDYPLTGNGNANDHDRLDASLPNQSPYMSSGASLDPFHPPTLDQIVNLVQQPNLQHNATSLSPSSMYYGHGSPATISSPPVKTPQDGSSGALPQYFHTSAEANLPLFPGIGPSTGSINPNRFDYKPHQYHSHHSLPANYVYSPTQVAPTPMDPTAANSSNAQHIAHVPVPALEPTINDLLVRCPQQDVDELRERHNKLASDAELQNLHLRIMWQWYTEREKPKNDDLLKFHRAIHPRANSVGKGTGSRGGAAGYTCLWPGCTKQEQPSRSDRAQEHTLLHLALKPFRCADCDAEFTRHNELKRHDKTCKTKRVRGTSVDESRLYVGWYHPTNFHEAHFSSSSGSIFETDVVSPSSSRRNPTRFPQRPTTKKTRAVRGVSTDPSSGANSPTSPMASRSHLALFASMTVESQDQSQPPQPPSHHFFMSNDSISPTAPGYNGVQVCTNGTHGGVFREI